MGDGDGGENGADARAGAEQAESEGAGVEDLARVDGEERDGAAEEDGEEVEADGPEDDFVAPDVAEAIEDEDERSHAARALLPMTWTIAMKAERGEVGGGRAGVDGEGVAAKP